MRLLPLLALLILLGGCAAPSPSLAPTPAVVAKPAPWLLNTIVDAKGGQGEPSLAVAPDGTLYTTGPGQSNAVSAPAGLTMGTVYRSSDNGTTWTEVNPNFRTPNLDADLVAAEDGTVWADNLYA